MRSSISSARSAPRPSKAICCEHGQPYIDVIQVRAGQAVLVFDKFHIVSHLMKAVDQVRRDEIREKGPAQIGSVMHKTRFTWLKNSLQSHRAAAPSLSELQRPRDSSSRRIS